MFGCNFAMLFVAHQYWTAHYQTNVSYISQNLALLGYNFAVLYFTPVGFACLVNALLFNFFNLISSVALAIGSDAVTQSGIVHSHPYLTLVELCFVEV